MQICRDLIRIDTSNYGDDSGPGERAAAEHVMGLLTEVGLDPELFESAPGRASVVVRLEGEDSSRPALVLHGHLDVVPARAEDWSVDPFGAEEVDGLVWGRGAVDMKDMDAMILSVVRQMAREGRKPARDVVVAMFADEEAGGSLGRTVGGRPPPGAVRGRHRGDQRGRRLLGRRRRPPRVPAADRREGAVVAAARRRRPRGARQPGQRRQRGDAPGRGGRPAGPAPVAAAADAHGPRAARRRRPAHRAAVRPGGPRRRSTGSSPRSARRRSSSAPRCATPPTRPS